MHQCYSTVFATKALLGADPGSILSPDKKILVLIFQDLITLKDFNYFVAIVKSDLKGNRSPGTLTCAVIPGLEG